MHRQKTHFFLHRSLLYVFDGGIGTGGVGNSVDMALVRMGVDTLHILDYDTVDATNLNRQILFSKADVGRRKVGARICRLTK